MASLHTRNRIVVFRLSDEEYNSLRSACVAAGGRSLSDFTRSELLTVVQTDSRSSAIERKFVEIDRKLDEVYSFIKHASGRITSPEPSLAEADNGAMRE
jgi:hypothetical protein